MRCGTKLTSTGVEIPFNAILQTGSLGREFYISCIEGNEAIIRYTDDGSTIKIPLNKINVK